MMCYVLRVEFATRSVTGFMKLCKSHNCLVMTRASNADIGLNSELNIPAFAPKWSVHAHHC